MEELSTFLFYGKSREVSLPVKKQFVILILTTIFVGLIASACNTAQQVSPTGVSTQAAETSPTADPATSTRALDGQAWFIPTISSSIFIVSDFGRSIGFI